MSESGCRGLQGRAKVLVVDDSRVVRAVVIRYLRTAGYEVEEATNGNDALRLLARGNYDVVITDLRMPELDGFGVLSGVKRVAPDTEVIILTGTHAQDVNSAVRALRLGAHDYLTKPPANADEVILTVQRAVEKKRLREANHRLLRELEELTRTDALTGVPNRRAFEEALAREVANARRHRYPLGVVILDIDHFKSLNDNYGHQAGDEALRSFATIAASVMRKGNVLYRYGGEEFVALLPHANLAGAMTAAERLVTAVAGTPLRIGSGEVSVTASAGVACLSTSDFEGASVVARADTALYEAKSRGRNRACSEGATTHLALVANNVR